MDKNTCIEMYYHQHILGTIYDHQEINLSNPSKPDFAASHQEIIDAARGIYANWYHKKQIGCAWNETGQHIRLKQKKN